MSNGPKRHDEPLQIFKLQRPIIGDLYLAYNEERTIMDQFPHSTRLQKLFGMDLKIYVEGWYLEKKKLIVIERLLDKSEEPDW